MAGKFLVFRSFRYTNIGRSIRRMESRAEDEDEKALNQTDDNRLRNYNYIHHE